MTTLPTTTKLKVSYNPAFAASKNESDTTRKAVDIVQSLIHDPIEGLEIVDPESFYGLAEDIISRIHSTGYVKAVRTGNPRPLAQSNNFSWDRDIYTMARAHVAGMIAATQQAVTNGCLAGSLSSGMHHAAHEHGAGFCTFNGLAAAMLVARDLGARRILCLDLDAHAGGGTWDIMQRIFDNDVVQVDVTVSAYDTWTPSGDSTLEIVDPGEYRDAVEKALDNASSMKPFDLIIYNAGVDIRNSRVSEDDLIAREDMVRAFVGNTPAVFGLAGGYTWGRFTIEDVVGWHRLTISRWAQAN